MTKPMKTLAVLAFFALQLVGASTVFAQVIISTLPASRWQTFEGQGLQFRMELPADGRVYHKQLHGNKAHAIISPQGSGALNVKYLGQVAEGHLYSEVFYFNGVLMLVRTTITDTNGNILRRF